MRKNNSKTKKTTYEFIPETVSITDLQRNSKDIVDRVKESTQPYFVMRNNKPEMVMISMDEYEELKKFKREFEMESALKAVAEYKKEKKAGTLKELKGSLYDLWKELQNEDKN